ncbi:hypothetical protein [Cochlodiniinecator piscidefendens]|uniref:hypothetical protein n=1 Tax=Cochlodiniinecator piscidefendens TaxID=2715756 RepID=UPI00140B115F|nr:hypothetical protein [Cochlodiniinecator piscidefendens]
MPNKLNALEELTQLALDTDLQAVKALNSKESALNADIAALREKSRTGLKFPTEHTMEDLGFAATQGDAVARWCNMRIREKLAELAKIRVEKETLTAKAKISFGRNMAIQKLAEAAQLEMLRKDRNKTL